MSELLVDTPSVCIVGLANLQVLAPEHARSGVGGAERQQVMLARALARRGFDVSMIVYDRGQPDGQVWDGITTYAAYGATEGLPGLRFIHPRSTRLWSAMKRADADIYYFSCAGMHLGVAAMFARSYGRKVVFRIASDMDCDPELHVLRYWRHKVMYRYGLRRADAVLAQTAKQQAMLATHLGRSSQIVPPLSDLSRHGLARADRDISVLWVNNLRDSKRADLLLELARRMPDVQFDMVGGPVKGFESIYEDANRTAQALENVRFHGFVPYEKTAELYERAHLLVSTSEIEGFPNTYLQAWASGAPVIAFFDPDGAIQRNGLGRAVKTLDEMQAAIQRLLTNEAEWEATGARCRAHVASYGDENSMLAPYIETFLSLKATAAERPLRARPRPAASRE